MARARIRYLLKHRPDRVRAVSRALFRGAFEVGERSKWRRGVRDPRRLGRDGDAGFVVVWNALDQRLADARLQETLLQTMGNLDLAPRMRKTSTEIREPPARAAAQP